MTTTARINLDWTGQIDRSRLSSPALLLGIEPIRQNLRRMLSHVQSPARLRPHVKTHKLGWLIQEQSALGITRFKCATIAEAELCAHTGAPDVLLAMQPVGPAIARLLELQQHYPRSRFSTIVDSPDALADLARAAISRQGTVELLLDLDIGQGRTGIPPGDAAIKLYEQITRTPGVSAGGLHAYDGHLNQPDPAERAAACEAAFAPVEALRTQLLRASLPVPRLVVGGTPTFPMHARRQNVECSPGTCVLWDASYATNIPDLDFTAAAALLTRVVSKPSVNRICIDLGHKAVASEMPHPRVVFPALPGAKAIAHSEEHLVLEADGAKSMRIGDTLLGVPWHICPTVALQSEVFLVESTGEIRAHAVEARARRLTI